MTTIISGSSPSITFSDSTTQTTAFTSTPSVTSITTSADASINGLTVGRGAGAVSTNTVVGASAFTANSTGADNVAIGRSAGSNATGSYGTYVGSLAGNASITGNSNTAVGYYAYGSGTSGTYNVAIGQQALYLNQGASSNTAVGYQAGYSNITGINSTFVGDQAGYSQTIYGANTFFGHTAGYSVNNTSAYGFNSFIGYGAGYYVTTGVKNTIIGAYSGNQGGLDIRTASNNIVLSDGDGNPRGYFDNSGYFYLGTSNVDIRVPSSGGIAHFGYITSGSQLQVSYNSVSAGVSLGSGATSWGTFSDERLKNVTGTYSNALADIAQIQPVKFTWKNDPDSKPQVGVIAQSVQSVVPEAMDSTTYEMNGDTEYLQVRYTELIPLMIASIQELKAEFDAYKATHP